MDSPFLRPYDAGLAEVVTDAAVHILAGHGVDRFSIRAIARWMRVTPAYLLNDFSRARLLEIIVITFGDRWLGWCGAEMAPGTLGPKLPETPDERVGVRVRMALEQLAEAEALRDNPAPFFQVQFMVQRELEMLTTRLASLAPTCCPPLPDEVDGLHALVVGLRLGLASRERSMDVASAKALLSSAADGLTRHRRGCPHGVAMAS